MRKKYRTNRSLYLFNMVAFIGFAFEFFIRDDLFLGCVMIFTGMINLIAFQQAPRRVASITAFLNFFNAHVAAVVAYNYIEQDYAVLTFVWIGIAVAYLISTLRQVYSIIAYKRHRRKHKRKMNS
ncbi:MAG: hypothetical protein RIC95_05625 [Vicingaceae bacterium]